MSTSTAILASLCPNCCCMYDEPYSVRRQRYQAGLLIRAATCTIFIGVFVVTASLVAPAARPPFVPASIALLFLTIINYPFWLLGKANEFPLAHFYGHWCVDLFMLTTILHALGGIDLPCGFGGYLIMIVTSAVFLSQWASLIVATGSVVAFDGLVIAEYMGWLVHQGGVWDHRYSTAAQVTMVLASNVFFYLFAFLVGSLSTALKAVNEKLVEARDKLAQYNQSLEDEVRHRTIALQQKTTEIEEFVQIVTHDLRNASVGIAEVARRLAETDDARLSERGRRYARHLRDDTRHLNQMLSQLLSLFKIDNTTARLERVDLSLVASAIIAQNRRRLDEKGIVTTVDVLPEVAVDELQVKHVLSNLIDNAIKYTGDKNSPQISICAVDDVSHYRIEVSDNGIGVPDKQQQRIFQLYQRGSDQRVNGVAQTGAGIGLAIAKRMVERWGGEIGVSSRSGEGSTFFFTIPKVIAKDKDEEVLGRAV